MSKPPTTEQCQAWIQQAYSSGYPIGHTDLHVMCTLAAAWGYEQGAREMRERAARILTLDWDRGMVNDADCRNLCAKAIRALDPAPVKPCPCGTMYCAIESGSNVPEDYAARCRRRTAAAQEDRA